MLTLKWRNVSERSSVKGGKRRVLIYYQGYDTSLTKGENGDSVVFGKPEGMAPATFEAQCKAEYMERLEVFGAETALKHAIRGSRIAEQRDDANQALANYLGTKSKGPSDSQKLAQAVQRHAQLQAKPVEQRSDDEQQFVEQFMAATSDGFPAMMKVAKDTYIPEPESKSEWQPNLIFRTVTLGDEPNLPIGTGIVIDENGNPQEYWLNQQQVTKEEYNEYLRKQEEETKQTTKD